MSKYEYNKKYAEKYNKENTKTLTIRFQKKEYELLEKYSNEHDLSKSSVIKQRIEDIINPK